MDHGGKLMSFPPVPVYPNAIDSDYTLFSVFNTTETRLSADNMPWSQEIEIFPVAQDELEIWADNGFGNIEGELFYYDSVEKNSFGKVNKLKRCARQIGGEKTGFNKKGTWVRSYVVAEHHNQLVQTILKMQDFVGRQFDPRIETLDWRIRNLQDLSILFDDFACPDINFFFDIISDDPVSGILTSYSIEVTPPGSINSFRLDFGDGEFTTTDLVGEHRYAVNARIDPVVRAANDKCQIIQTPVERDNPAEPTSDTTDDFDIPIAEIPPFPDFTFVPCDVPEPDINLPPLVIPCLSFEGQIGPIPSVITGPDINMVSQVIITSNNPINITQSVIEIIGGNIPSLIIIDPPIPPTIIIDPPIPPTIVIVPPQSNITLDLNLENLPRLEVDWGTPPEMEVALTMARPVKTPQKFAKDPELVSQFGEEFADLFDTTIKVEAEPVGLPSEIKILPPDDMTVRLDASELSNRRIRIDCSGVNIPTEIKMYGPETPIPDSIKLDASDLVAAIDMMRNMSPIKIDGSNIPHSIDVKIEKEIPTSILVEMPKPIPDRIIVDSNIPSKIELVSPNSIPLSMPKDVFLPVKFPEVMPKVEMVYTGAPIELKITMDKIIEESKDGKNCVMIVPCER